ncbi:2-succinylbenzoate-CoA ligase [Psychromonas sp. RZ22]|uniref:AMP-binding protein n=1 Tax=Psychromonas algarum TaxID=2555643 RepID=UPI0010684B98|nr:AMP-binding protein [Psychromonas sp. RZ22]TEW53894.1 2-succinylbenzoate-CoA ligase [Psychromonas sp. RZ22]
MALLINYCPVRWQAVHHSQSIALQDDQKQLTFLQVDQLLNSLQKQLSKKIGQSDEQQVIRLVCIASNSVKLILLQLLCIRLGWLFCPLNPRFTQSEIQQRLTILNSPYCWVDECNKQTAEHARFNTLQLDFSLQNIFIEEPIKQLIISPIQACNIIFTSGSSGFPKAIVHNYQNHFFSALGSQKLIPLTPHEHNLLSLPLFHIGGYATVIRSIIAGACIHLTQSPLTLSLLQERSITHISLVSTQLIRLLTEPLFIAEKSTIKHLLLGGSAFSKHLLSTVEERGFNYHLSYGSTEMASQIATSTNNSELKILPHREIKIQEGEILLRGKTRFIAYFQDQGFINIDEKQWVKSGDTGALNKSVLQVSGRKDRQFISGGENIIPEEIERVCLQLTQVKQAYICPIADKQYGQRMVLFVAFNNPENKEFEKQIQQLKSHLEKNLTRFKRPEHYFPWPLLTEAQTLKIPKQAFQTILKEQGLY